MRSGGRGRDRTGVRSLVSRTRGNAVLTCIFGRLCRAFRPQLSGHYRDLTVEVTALRVAPEPDTAPSTLLAGPADNYPGLTLDRPVTPALGFCSPCPRSLVHPTGGWMLTGA